MSTEAATKGDTLSLWNAVCTTDPRHTKTFTRGGGFSGTAINSTYLLQKATALWGPMGAGWRVEIVEQGFMKGAPLIQNKLAFEGDKVIAEEPIVVGHEQVHFVRIRLVFPTDSGEPGTVEHFGQTTFVGQNKRGFFTDEEAPKKSLTDAIGKCLSMLGFSSDVYLGMFDDSKYVNDKKASFEAAEKAEEAKAAAKAKIAPKASAEEIVAAKAALSAATSSDELRGVYESLTDTMKQIVKEHTIALARAFK